MTALPPPLPPRLRDRLALNRFLVLGRAGMDLYADPPGTRIEEAHAFVSHLGGSAANIAVALVRLGAQVLQRAFPKDQRPPVVSLPGSVTGEVR